MSLDKFLVDSNIPIIATGQIGEAWAVVILEEIAKNKVEACSHFLFNQELLEVYYKTGEHYKGKKIYKSFNKIIEECVEITEKDFKLSYELHKKYPELGPRDLLNGAIMMNNKIDEVFSVDGPILDQIEGVEIVSLPVLLKKLDLKGNYNKERVQERENVAKNIR